MADHPRNWREAVTLISRCDAAAEVERLTGAFPTMISADAIAEVEREIDVIEAGAPGDWWGLTRAVMLLRGVAEGELDDALLRARTRDLLVLGPADIDEVVQRHPELLGRHVDILLHHWASQRRDSREQQQIELRRNHLRMRAAGAFQEAHDMAMAAEREHGETGSRAALERALAIRRGLLSDAAPYTYEDHFQSLRQGMSRLLQRRFEVTGNLGDLNEAIDVAAAGLEAVSEPSLRGALLTEVGNSLNCRFRELQDPADIDLAIRVFTEVSQLPPLPAGDPDDAVTNTVNLGMSYLNRGFFLGDPDDLDRALALARQALDATPGTSPRRWMRMNNLASALRAVAKARHDLTLLPEALDLLGQAQGTPDPTLRAHIAAGLAETLDDADNAGLHLDNVDEAARSACRLGLEVNVSAAVWAGMSWGRSAWAGRRWEAAAEAYGYMGRAVGKYLRDQREESDQEIRLSQFREVGARAAYALAKVGRVEDAVLAFELSRAQLLAEAMSEEGIGSPGLAAAPDADSVLQTIDEVRAAVAGRSLAYLVSTELGGAALLVLADSVRSIDLPALTDEAVSRYVAEQVSGDVCSERSRSWLWESVMGPLLAEVAEGEHLVIVAGGLLGLLPLHAASLPDPGRPTGHCYAIDLVPLTFAPSARTLRGSSTPPTPDGRHTLVVANPQPVSGDPLELAMVEAAAICHMLAGAMALPRQQATLRAVLDALPGMRTVHFACHGTANLERPLVGGLVVAGDEVLTVDMLRTSSLSQGTAILSACQTGLPGVALPDEVVGLPSALLQAGLTTVIASLWNVLDDATAILMIELYRQMVCDGRTPADSLRRAQQWVRDTTDAEKAATWRAASGDWLPAVVTQWLLRLVGPDEARSYAHPQRWAAFIHVGA